MTNKLVSFKGGPIRLHSGGMGPDDYLLKPIKGGRWHVVKFRWGRNFLGRQIGVKAARRIAEADRAAMTEIFPIEQICVSDVQRLLERLERENAYGVPDIGAAEFWEKYQDCDTKRLW